jgi:hypothetical protein
MSNAVGAQFIAPNPQSSRRNNHHLIIPIEVGAIMRINKLLRASVRADLSRPPPIYRLLVDIPISHLISPCALSRPYIRYDLANIQSTRQEGNLNGIRRYIIDSPTSWTEDELFQ